MQNRPTESALPVGLWFLSSHERGNPSARLDAPRAGGAGWTEGNLVRPLIHGATYFAELHQRVSQMRQGDLLLFVDWRGDSDEQLNGTPDSAVGTVLADAARRGVDVRGLLWRSHWDRLSFSASANRHLGDEINAAGGQCLLDMRVRAGGSHHQKFVVLRPLNDPSSTSPMSEASTCAIADAMMPRIAATRSHSRLPRPMVHNLRGTMCSSPSAVRLSVTWRLSSANVGRTLRRSVATPCAGSGTESGRTTRPARRCLPSTPTPSRPEPMQFSCSEPIHGVPAATPSHLEENGAWRAATPRR